MKQAFALVAPVFLTFIILISVFAVLQPPTQEAPEPQSKPFYVGVQFGYGDAAACRALVDKVKNYTNLIVISNTAITTNEALLNETCDYIYNAGLHMVMYFPEYQSSQGSFAVWAMRAKDRYGDYFLGVYVFDEAAGRAFDRDPGCVSINYRNSASGPSYSTSTALDYKVASSNFEYNARTQMDDYLYLAQKAGTDVITADYCLYWFDYKAGYNVVLTELGWGDDHQMAIALCRGAATAQGKDWGTIICWETRTNEQGFIENGTELYKDLVLSYESGAKYAVIFNYAGNNQPNPYECGIMDEEHFDALKNFWTYIQAHPEKHGSIAVDNALVIPQAYGFGFRRAEDKVWGFDDEGQWKSKIWEDANSLLTQYGGSLDIVYGEPEFQAAIGANYVNVIRWLDGTNTDDYPVVNLNSSMGFETIQEAVNSMTTYSGDVIYVKAGTYQENIVISKSISLVGENKANTIIDGGNVSSAVTFLGASQVSMSGFTLRNGNNMLSGLSGSDYYAILVRVLRQLGLSETILSGRNSTELKSMLNALLQTQRVNQSAGIVLSNANNCSISGNNVENSECGILLLSSANNTLEGNSVVGCKYGLGVSAGTLEQYVNFIDTSNTINGKPVYYWIDKDGLTVPSNAGTVALIDCTNINVHGLTLSGTYNGLLIVNTRDSTITGNTISGNYNGLIIQNSSGNIFSDNEINGNEYGFNYTGNVLPNSIDTSNRIDGKPIYLWYNEHDRTVPSDAGYVALINCTRITVKNLNLTGGQGILLQNTTYSEVSQNNLAGMDCAIHLSWSSNNIITENSITDCKEGIIVEHSADNNVSINVITGCENSAVTFLLSTSNTLQGNVLENNEKGGLIQDSSLSTIQGNSVNNNTYGLQFSSTPMSNGLNGELLEGENCTANSVTENVFGQNRYGIYLSNIVFNNTFYHNDFKNNVGQVNAPYYSVETSSNFWDNGSEGNYWSNYNGTDANHDGIGDQPVNIQQNNYPEGYPYQSTDQDHFPLMNPFME